MRNNFRLTAFLLLAAWSQANAQEQLDFKQQVQKIDDLVNEKSMSEALEEVNLLKEAIKNTSIEKEDSVQLYFSSKLALIYFELDQCDSAISNAHEEVQLRTRIYGDEHPQKLASLRNLGVYQLSCGDIEAAKESLKTCLITHQNKLNRIDQLLLLTMDDLAFSYGKLGMIDSAGHYYDQLLQLLASNNAKNNFYYQVMDNYSALLSNYDRFDQAADFFDELSTYKSNQPQFEGFLGDYYNIFTSVPDYGGALRVCEMLLDHCESKNCDANEYSRQGTQLNAARLSVLLGQWASGGKYYDQVLQNYSGNPMEEIKALIEASEVARILNNNEKQFNLLSKALDKHRKHNLTDSSSFSQTVFRLGNALTTLGRFQEADDVFSNYINDLSSSSGAAPLMLAKANQAIGNQRFLLQNFKDADFYFNKAEQILRDNALLNTKEAASIKNSKGALFESLANVDAAESNYREALSVIENQKINAPSLKIALASNLAKVLMKNKPESDSILMLLSHAIGWQELSTGQLHPGYAILIANRAKYFHDKQNYAQAESDYLKSLGLLEQTVGKNHPDYLSNASNLGLLYTDKGQFEEAEKFLREAKELFEEYYTKDHPGYLLTINNLAKLYTETEAYSKAEVLLSEMSIRQIKQIRNSFSYLSESEKEQFVAEKRKFLQNFKRYIIARGQNDPDALSKSIIKDWYNLELATKGILLSSTKRVRDGIFESGNIELITLFSEWTMLRKQIADMSSLKASQLKDSQSKIAELEQKISDIEKELSRKSSDFNESFTDQVVSFEAVQSVLQPNEAAVEIVKTDLDNDAIYAALVITKHLDYPKLIFVGNGDRLEKNGFSYYKNSIKYTIEDDVSYQTYWKPIDQFLLANGITKIFYAPDGVYHKISLATIYNASNKAFLLDTYQIVQLTSTKDVTQTIRLPSQMWDPKSSTYLLVGRPHYDLDGIQDEAMEIKTRSFNISNLTDLPGTEEEIKTVAGLLQEQGVSFQQFLHAESNEQNVKANLGYDVIHLATHGFFLDESSMITSGAKLDPMLYSGLLFAGASDQQLKKNTGEDGILTAFEIMNLGFSGNKMVILSACETGLGEISAGEGIYGLQRAFFVAGTETIIMSLWSVDDKATKDLMTTFYKNLLKKGDKREAFAEAQKKIKKQYKHPFYWGAFVMIGI